MKKILLATTVLVATTGFAAAEVTLSGDARMGVTYNEANAGDELAFNSRARVTFTMSGETDGGLSFGASFRADNAATRLIPDGTDADALPDVAGGANDGQAGSVFISGAFGKLSMGDVSSAAENAVGDLVGVGYTGIGDANEMTYISTGDNEMALYEYSAGAFTGYFSVGQPSGGGSNTYSL
ncbi:MAG: porin, partial [Alphaproteobacteria bacterium]